MSENTKIYPKGISFFNPRQNAPSWVKGSVIITPNELFKWLKENESLLIENEKYGKQIKFQVTEKGMQVDTWQPTEQQHKVPTERKTAADNIKPSQNTTAEPFAEELPF
jgi:hypothetical protein